MLSEFSWCISILNYTSCTSGFSWGFPFSYVILMLDFPDNFPFYTVLGIPFYHHISFELVSLFSSRSSWNFIFLAFKPLYHFVNNCSFFNKHLMAVFILTIKWNFINYIIIKWFQNIFLRSVKHQISKELLQQNLINCHTYLHYVNKRNIIINNK